MENSEKDSFGAESMMNTLAQAVNDMMGTVSHVFSAYQTANSSGSEGKKGLDNENMAAINTFLKNCQTITSAMLAPESLASLFKGSGTMPELLNRFGQAVTGSLSELQSKMSQGASRFGESVDGYNFEKIDENIFHVWTELYENEFQKFFQIPQLGLTREYQERINHMMDKFHLFQANQAEFLRLLGLPFQRSFGVMQEKIAVMTEADELPDNANEYYQMWIKILEGHFMTLFQTPEYVGAMTKTINSLTHFTAAKNAVIEDMIKGLPIARQSEMDDLAEDVYELKRRIRKLEKSN